MDLNKKIEEVRKKPEHVRMRYVWGCVIASILVIFSFWVFSLKNNFNKFNNSDKSSSSPLSDLTSGFKEITTEGKDSLNPSLDSIKSIGSSLEQEALKAKENSSD